MEEHACWLAFSYARGVGPRRFQRLLAYFGCASAAWAAPAARLLEVPGMDEATCREIVDLRQRLDPRRTLGELAAAGIGTVATGTPDYPARLGEIENPPFLLFTRGCLLPQDSLAVAVVGSRQADGYGLEMARRIAGGLARAGITVVSGLAMGIDAAAHEAALAAGGRTIAVLGSGVEPVYPRTNAGLAARVAGQGAVISEYPPGTPALPGNFPARNRIISGLTLATVVVRAGRRSGALITAELALEQNREVFAVPGPVGDPLSAGVHNLLREGAGLAEHAGDVLAGLGMEALEQPADRLKGDTEQVQPDLDGDERVILGQLGTRPRSAEEVAWGAAMPFPRVAALLLSLELKGLAARLPGGLYRRSLL